MRSSRRLPVLAALFAPILAPILAPVLAPLLALALFSLPAFAQGIKQAPQIVTHTLGNGLELVVIPDRRAPVVTHMIWYKVGAADEQRGKSGIAHFLEHLMFKGTDAVGEGEFSRVVAANGGDRRRRAQRLQMHRFLLASSLARSPDRQVQGLFEGRLDRR